MQRLGTSLFSLTHDTFKIYSVGLSASQHMQLQVNGEL